MIIRTRIFLSVVAVIAITALFLPITEQSAVLSGLIGQVFDGDVLLLDDLIIRSGTGFDGTISHTITAARTWTLPDETGTLVTQSQAFQLAYFDTLVTRSGSTYTATQLSDFSIISSGTNFRTVLLAVINADTNDNNNKILLGPGDFITDDLISMVGDNIVLQGWSKNSTRILSDPAMPGSRAMLRFGSNDAADNVFYDLTCSGANPSGCKQNNATLTFDVAQSENNFTRFDIVTIVTDKDTYQSDLVSNYPQGESHFVRSVNDTAGTITLFSGLFEDMGEQYDPRISPWDDDDRTEAPILRDLTFFDQRPASTGGTSGFNCLGCVNGLIENLDFLNVGRPADAVRCIGCIDTTIKQINVFEGKDALTSGGAGVVMGGGHANTVTDLYCMGIRHCVDTIAAVTGAASFMMYWGVEYYANYDSIVVLGSEGTAMNNHPSCYGCLYNNIQAVGVNMTGGGAQCFHVRGNYTTITNANCMNMDSVIETSQDGGNFLQASNVRGINMAKGVLIRGNATNIQLDNFYIENNSGSCLNLQGSNANEPTINSGDNSTFTNFTCIGNDEPGIYAVAMESNRWVTLRNFWIEGWTDGIKDFDDETPGRGGHLILDGISMVDINSDCIRVEDMDPVYITNLIIHKCSGTFANDYPKYKNKWIQASSFWDGGFGTIATLKTASDGDTEMEAREFDDTAVEAIVTGIPSPDLATEYVFVRVIWIPNISCSAGEDVEWAFRIAGLSDGDNVGGVVNNLAFGFNVTDDVLGDCGDIKRTDILKVDVTGFPDNDWLYIEILRDATAQNAADDYNSQAKFLGLDIFY